LGASVGASSIAPDNDANHAYYGMANVDPTAVLRGDVYAYHPEGQQLTRTLPM
jgi:lipid-binding SYLF domain-containing protein